MILKSTLNTLINISKIIYKYSIGDIKLLKCKDGKWRGWLLQPQTDATSIKFSNFYIEIDEDLGGNLEGDVTSIFIPFSLIEYMSATKKKDFDTTVVDTFLGLNILGVVTEESFTPFLDLKFETIELEKGAYIEYKSSQFHLDVEPTVFPTVTYRTPSIDVAYVQNVNGYKEIAIATQEDKNIKIIGTVMVL